VSEPYVISPDALYDDAALSKALGIRPGSLDRARKNGELRFTKRGGRVLYLGRWVQDWLTREEPAVHGPEHQEAAV
jgi:hypothetical protein